MFYLSLILPIHNEDEIIESVFEDIKKVIDKLNTSYECILVENGSTDNSLETIKKISQKNKNVYVITAPKGYGSAVLAGLKKAKGKYVCYMPSDGQVDLTVFPQLWEKAVRGKWDLVKIKRITRESWQRLVVSRAFSLILTFLFGTNISDINGSPRIFLREKLSQLNLQSKDSFIDAEFAIKAHTLSLSVLEVPMKNLERAGGISTRSWKTFAEFFINIVRFRSSDH